MIMQHAHIHGTFPAVLQDLKESLYGIPADSHIPGKIVAGACGNEAEPGPFKIPDALDRFIDRPVSTQDDEMHRLPAPVRAALRRTTLPCAELCCTELCCAALRQFCGKAFHIARFPGKMYLIRDPSLFQRLFHKLPVPPAPPGAGGGIDQKMIHMRIPLFGAGRRQRHAFRPFFCIVANEKTPVKGKWKSAVFKRGKLCYNLPAQFHTVTCRIRGGTAQAVLFEDEMPSLAAGMEEGMYSLDEVRKADPEIAQAIVDEQERQNSHIELIASENWVSKAVMAAMGSPLTNKYAEGYPGKRYYGGCQCVDVAEDLARERAKELFGCEYANVQPHSGAQANMAVMFAMLTPGDTVMGMNLDHGGHLTHGSPVNMSGKYFHIVPYGVNDEGVIDYDNVLSIAKECRPKLIIAGASAYARTIDFKRFREIADEVGAYLMVDMAHIAGLVAAGLHPSPIPYAHVTTTTTHKTLRGPRGGMILSSNEVNEKFNFNKAVFPGIQGGPLMHVIAAKAVCFKEALQPEFKEYQAQIIKNTKALCEGLQKRGIKIVSGGTDNHLILVDLTEKDVSGKELEKRLDDAHITCNKNTIPNDPRSPFVTSGVRLGTPAVTTRGMNEADMDKIAGIIAMVIESEDNIEAARKLTAELTEKYPLC